MITTNLVFVGLGTVQGTVRNPNGTLANGVNITLHSANPAGGRLPLSNFQLHRVIHH